MRKTETRDPALHLWRTAEGYWRRAGLAQRPHEGPRDYTQRVIHQWPEHAALAENIAKHYIRARYGKLGDTEPLTSLRQAVLQLKSTRLHR